MSREHIWPQAFIEKLVPRHPAGRYVQQRQVGKGAAYGPRSNWTTHQVDVVATAVCTQCNSGWMNTLDQGLEPLLLALARGESCVVDPASAARLAAWATKLALLFADQVPQLTPNAGECAALRLHQLPSSGYTIWLAYSATRVPVTWVETIRLRSPSDPQADGFVSTFRVGSLVAQVLRAPDESTDHWQDHRSDAVLLWPNVGAIGWPPPDNARISDETALATFSRLYTV